MLDELVILEIAECTLGGCPGQAADFEEARVAAELVEEYVGVTLTEGVAHDVGTEHGFAGVARVAALAVWFVKLFDQRAGA